MATKTSPSRRSGSSGSRSRPSKKKDCVEEEEAVQDLRPDGAVAVGARRPRHRAHRPVPPRRALGLVRGRRSRGQGIAWLIGGAFGIGAYAFPVFGAWWGFVLLKDTAREDRVRMFIGCCVLVAGVLGLVSLFAGQPELRRRPGGARRRRRDRGRLGRLAARPSHLADRRGDRVRGARDPRAVDLHRHAVRGGQGEDRHLPRGARRARPRLREGS